MSHPPRRLMTWLSCLALSGCAAVQVAKLGAIGDRRQLRDRPDGQRPSSPDKPPILLLALDGVSRDLLYELLRRGALPNLATLLGGADGRFAHAYFEEHLLSTLPSSTMAAWMTTMTGVAPAVHGVTGNEFFVRETRTLACPAPVSFSSAAPTLSIYTEDYLDQLGASPTVYERMRETDPDLLVWVAMHNVYRGADRLLLAKKAAIVNAFEGFIEVEVQRHLASKESRRIYSDLDTGVITKVVDDLERGPIPDVLTIYLTGTDLYAHVAEEGPDPARTAYLVEVLDPLLGKLAQALQARRALADRWIVVTSDHGHTQVVHDDVHALSTKAENPPSILERSGFRVRPFKQTVSSDDPFSAVLAYGGAMAYVYLADRSACPGEKEVCDWKRPPRYAEDVLAAAEAFYQNNEDGSIVPKMRGALDMILVRRPKPYEEIDLPFEVYLGGGKTSSVDAWLRDHPHPTYVALDARLRDLAVGLHGERAGDLLLLAHNGDRDKPEARYYFASPYRSWHGSPSKQDSEIPLIVASRRYGATRIGAYVTEVLGDRPFQQKVTDVLLGLRAGAIAH